jgi:hypothetical protein
MGHTPNECYVDVWREAGFSGETRRLYGPASHPSLHLPEGDWGDDIGSLRVGPHAFVMVFRGENYADEMLALGPNDEAPDLRALRFENEIDSLRLINSLKIFERLYEAGVGGGDSHAAGGGAGAPEDAKAGRGKAARTGKGKRR